MNQWKKLVCLVLAVCSLSVVGTAKAAEVDPGTEITPMANRLVINKLAITRESESWYQQSGYDSYRVWVENTSNRLMAVTIRSACGSEYHRYFVSANSSKNYVVNDAVSGVHTISFDVGTATLSGTLSVRISEEPL